MQAKETRQAVSLLRGLIWGNPKQECEEPSDCQPAWQRLVMRDGVHLFDPLAAHHRILAREGADSASPGCESCSYAFSRSESIVVLAFALCSRHGSDVV